MPNKKDIDWDKISIPDDFYDQDSKDFERASLEDFIDVETLEEAAESELHETGELISRHSFIAGAKWQAKNMTIYIEHENTSVHIENGVVRVEKNDKSIMTYSEENMLDFAEYCLSHTDAFNTPKTNLFSKWLKQFKKI